MLLSLFGFSEHLWSSGYDVSPAPREARREQRPKGTTRPIILREANVVYPAPLTLQRLWWEVSPLKLRREERGKRKRAPGRASGVVSSF